MTFDRIRTLVRYIGFCRITQRLPKRAKDDDRSLAHPAPSTKDSSPITVILFIAGFWCAVAAGTLMLLSVASPQATAHQTP